MFDLACVVQYGYSVGDGLTRPFGEGGLPHCHPTDTSHRNSELRVLLQGIWNDKKKVLLKIGNVVAMCFFG